MLTVLQAYAVISTGVRITVSHVTANGAKSTVLATNARGTTLADNIADVFGAKCCSLLQLFALPIDDTARIDGFVSRAINSTGRSAGDRQFFYINRRPVDLPRFARTANDAYRLLNKKQYPMLFLNVSLPTDAYDINVTPNKREIMLHTERQLLDALKTALEAVYQPSELTMVVGDAAAAVPSKRRRKNNADDDDGDDDESEADDVADVGDDESGDDDDFASQARESASAGGSQSSTAAQQRVRSQSPPRSPLRVLAPLPISSSKKRPGSLSALDDLLSTAEFASPDSATSSVKRRRNLVRRESAPQPRRTQPDNDDDHSSSPRQPQSPQPLPVFVSDADVVVGASDVSNGNAVVGDDFDVDVGSLDELLARFTRRLATPPTEPAAPPSESDAASGGLSFFSKLAADSDADCCRELVRVFRKNHFAEMRVVGQFNLGFIIARLGKDVFIVDQHATDEKFNYERLAASTVLQTQRLIAPLRLELTAQEEDIVIDNMATFEMNGFAFAVQADAAPRERVRLVGRPFSKATEFGVADIQEMIFMLGERPGEPCRPSRVGAMLAMRACRSSVMIGMALTHAAMLNIVTRMADMTAPWSCPHGRPTMRHLFDRSRLPVPPARFIEHR